MTRIAIAIYDDFDDTDLIISWRFFRCIKRDDWHIDVVGTAPSHRSLLGLSIPTTAPLRSVKDADAVMVVGGPGSRVLAKSTDFLAHFELDPARQIIGSQCSGSLILEALDLIGDNPVTTIISARDALKATGANIVDRPMIVNGNVATAGGCLANAYLATWILYRVIGEAETDAATELLLPTGEAGRFRRDVHRLMGSGSAV